MALQKVNRNLLNTGVSDSSDATAITIDSSENVGIGETSPLGKLHAKVSDTGASASAQGNLLVLEDTENGLSILSSTSGAGYINFGDSDDNDIGMIIYDHSANAMRFWTNAAERMRIDTNGNVGIGQTSLGHKLTVNGSAFDGIQLQSGGSDCGYLGVNTDTVYVGAGSNLIFHTGNAGLTNGTERMRIDSSGNVGVGTTSPSRILDVEVSGGNALGSVVSGTSSLAGIVMGDTSADDQGGVIYNNDGDYLYFRTGGAERARILNGGGLTFNGDTAAANALDDYEEGTWTPSLTSGTPTYSVRSGRYTKIGNIVRLRCAIKLSAWASPSGGEVTVTGIPFNSTTGAYDHDWGAVHISSKPTDHVVVCGVDTNNVFFRRQDVTNADNGVVGTQIDADTGVMFTVTYQTT